LKKKSELNLLNDTIISKRKTLNELDKQIIAKRRKLHELGNNNQAAAQIPYSIPLRYRNKTAAIKQIKVLGCKTYQSIHQ